MYNLFIFSYFFSNFLNENIICYWQIGAVRTEDVRLSILNKKLAAEKDTLRKELIKQKITEAEAVNYFSEIQDFLSKKIKIFSTI